MTYEKPEYKIYSKHLRDHPTWSIKKIADHYDIPYYKLLEHNKRYLVRRSGVVSPETEQAIMLLALNKKDFNVTTVAELYNVSCSTVYRILKRHEIVRNRPKYTKATKAKVEQISKTIKEHPEFTIREIASELSMRRATVQYTIRKHKLPYQTKAISKDSDSTNTMLNLDPAEVQAFIRKNATYTKTEIAKAYGVNVKTFNNFLDKNPQVVYKSKRQARPSDNELYDLVEHLKRSGMDDYDIRTYVQRKYQRARYQTNHWLNTPKIKKLLFNDCR